ncbi:NUDIX domain-containing protein [Streptomyces carminius]|uniref:NUDIX domain-containing protein n=1 Tax=Streptomyces carminius TaxID=2665496 RepID=UPI0038CD75B7
MPQSQNGARSEALRPTLESTTLLVAAVIVHDRATDRIVLLQRGPRSAFAPGLWDLPTGKSEPDEPVTGTAVRELREETGLTVEPDSLHAVHLVHGSPRPTAPNGFLTVVFAAHEWAGEPDNREPEKHAQIRWFDTAALPGNLVPSNARALRAYLNDNGTGLSLHGWDGRPGDTTHAGRPVSRPRATKHVEAPPADLQFH